MFVDWAIRTTGLGIGRGVAAPGNPDACIVAAYLLSGGRLGVEYVRELPQFERVIELAIAHQAEFIANLKSFDDPGELFQQLSRLDHLAVRDAYQRMRLRVQSSIQSPQDLRKRGLRAEQVTKEMRERNLI